jgi:lysophospholipase L1-like esterase
VAALWLAAGPGLAETPAPRWVGTWAASQQVPEPRNALPDADLADATLRQVVRVSQGGPRIRLKLSNVFGAAPLAFSAVRVARPLAPGSPRVDPATSRQVTFAGRASVTIPAGADWLSDPIDFAVRPLERIAVSIHLPEAPARQTGHPGSRTTSWTLPGDHTAAADLPGARPVVHWYQLAGVDVATVPAPGGVPAAVVTFGDSITDGFGVGPDRDERWPDTLAARLQADPRTRHISVLNQGVGGNRVLKDELGPNAVARFERDVLAQPGVRWVIVLEGVNDLGTLTRDAPADAAAHRRLVADILAAYAQMVARARERGIRVIGATILPFAGTPVYQPTAAHEADRQAINAWIRAPGNFDAVIDFDALLRDPSRPDRLRPDVDSGDHLHPSLAGYRLMGEAVPLSLFLP